MTFAMVGAGPISAYVGGSLLAGGQSVVLIGIARQTSPFRGRKDSAVGEAVESSVFLEVPGLAG